MVTASALPVLASLFDLTGQNRLRRRVVRVPFHRLLTRLDNGHPNAFENAGIAGLLVISAVAQDLPRWLLAQLLQQVWKHLTLGEGLTRELGRHDVVSVRIHTEVPLLPAPTLARTVLADFLLALTEDLPSRRIDQPCPPILVEDAAEWRSQACAHDP